MKVTLVNNSIVKIPALKKVVEKPQSIKNEKTLMGVAAASAVAAATMVKKADVSIPEIEQKLLKNGFTKDFQGNLSRIFTEEEENALKKNYGFFTTQYKKVYQQPLDKESLQDFKNFLDIDKNKSRQMFDNNFDKMFFTYSLLKKNNLSNDFSKLCQENKSYYTLFQNLVNNAPDKNTEKVLYKHKLDAILNINESLREKALNKDYIIDDESQKLINTISDYIETQKISNPVKLYRGEGFEVMKNVTTKDGSSVDLSEMMNDAAKLRNPQEIEKVKKFILENDISIIQPGFMSVSLDKNVGNNFSRNGIVWELTTEPNAKGVYMEGVNIPSMHTSENEVFMQKGSKLKITDVDYNRFENVWKIKANLSN